MDDDFDPDEIGAEIPDGWVTCGPYAFDKHSFVGFWFDSTERFPKDSIEKLVIPEEEFDAIYYMAKEEVLPNVVSIDKSTGAVMLFGVRIDFNSKAPVGRHLYVLKGGRYAPRDTGDHSGSPSDANGANQDG